MKKVNKENKKSEYTKDFRDICNGVAQNNTDIQADSFNAIDSKAQTYISIIAIYIAILLGILAIGYQKITVNDIQCIKVAIIIGLILFLVKIGIFFLAIFSKPFKSGVSVKGLNNMKDKQIEEIEKEIFSNLYWSVSENKDVLEMKSRWLLIAEVFLGINFFYTILTCIYFIALL